MSSVNPLQAKEETDETCYICLDDCAANDGTSLMSPCQCPRKVHRQCLARWQLQQAGKAEEKHCRFCLSPLADWKVSLTPEPLKQEVKKANPIMVVYFEGVVHRIQVKPGDSGLQEFTERIRTLFSLEEDVDISLTFGCKEPMSGQHLKLEGVGAFDAAVHCASVAAAERAVRKPALPFPALREPPSFTAYSRFSATDVIQSAVSPPLRSSSTSSRETNPRRNHLSPSDPLPGNPLAGSSPFMLQSGIPPAFTAEFDPASYLVTNTPRTSSSSSRDTAINNGAVQRQLSPPLPTIYSERETTQESGSATPTAQIAVGGVDLPCSVSPESTRRRMRRSSSGIEGAPIPQQTQVKTFLASISTLSRKIKRSLLGKGASTTKSTLSPAAEQSQQDTNDSER